MFFILCCITETSADTHTNSLKTKLNYSQGKIHAQHI